MLQQADCQELPFRITRVLDFDHHLGLKAWFWKWDLFPSSGEGQKTVVNKAIKIVVKQTQNRPMVQRKVTIFCINPFQSVFALLKFFTALFPLTALGLILLTRCLYSLCYMIGVVQWLRLTPRNPVE
jgi:hypothetical protein